MCIYYVNQTNLVTLFPLFVHLLRELIFYPFFITPRDDFFSMFIYSVLTWNICEFSTIPPPPPPPPGGTLFLLLNIQYFFNTFLYFTKSKTRDSAIFSYGQNYTIFYRLLAQCVNSGFNFKKQICSREIAQTFTRNCAKVNIAQLWHNLAERNLHKLFDDGRAP